MMTADSQDGPTPPPSPEKEEEATETMTLTGHQMRGDFVETFVHSEAGQRVLEHILDITVFHIKGIDTPEPILRNLDGQCALANYIRRMVQDGLTEEVVH